MSEWVGKRYWLIGASEGLGRALAHRLNAMGAEVILSARSEDRLKDLVAELPGKASYEVVDVTDTDSVTNAAKVIGPVDGMVYLAGAYWPMSVSKWNADQAEKTVDVNFAGAMRAVGAVLPQMTERNAGHIVLTGSLSAYRGLPEAAAYGATKAGIMHLAESLYADLRGSGVKVQLANPGFIKTRLTDKNDFKMPFIMVPDAAARAMVELMMSDRFKRSFPGGFATVFRLAQFLPDFLYYPLFGGKG